MSPAEAAEKGLEYMYKRTGGAGGVIVLNKHGDIGVHFTTGYMAWAYVQKNRLHHGIVPGANETEDVE